MSRPIVDHIIGNFLSRSCGNAEDNEKVVSDFEEYLKELGYSSSTAKTYLSYFRKKIGIKTKRGHRSSSPSPKGAYIKPLVKFNNDLLNQLREDKLDKFFNITPHSIEDLCCISVLELVYHTSITITSAISLNKRCISIDSANNSIYYHARGRNYYFSVGERMCNRLSDLMNVLSKSQVYLFSSRLNSHISPKQIYMWAKCIMNSELWPEDLPVFNLAVLRYIKVSRLILSGFHFKDIQRQYPIGYLTLSRIAATLGLRV